MEWKSFFVAFSATKNIEMTAGKTILDKSQAFWFKKITLLFLQLEYQYHQ
jgi:hypothetical protein